MHRLIATNNATNNSTNNMQVNARSTSVNANVFQNSTITDYDEKAKYFDDTAWASIPYNKDAPVTEELQRFHSLLLMQLLDQLPTIMSSIYRELYGKYRTYYYPDMFCPVVVGGIAYTKYMEYANINRQGIFFSDDIDIKILVKPTCDQLNKVREFDSVRECIKLFRYMLTIKIMELVTELLAGRRDAKIHFGHAGGFFSLEQLKNDVQWDIYPLQLSVLSITYGKGASLVHLGCVDMTYYIRENDRYDDSQLMINYFYSYLRLASARRNSRNALIEPRTACDVVPRKDVVTLVANEEYVMMDTIRMLSKAEKFGDVCIETKDRTRVSDVRKFDKYVGKFLQLASVFGKLDANRAKEIYFEVFPVIPIRGKQSVRDKFRTLMSHPEVRDIYQYYIQFVMEPSKGRMNVQTIRGKKGGGGADGGETRNNFNTTCILMQPDQLYNDFGIVIQRNDHDPDINKTPAFFSMPQATGGGGKALRAKSAPSAPKQKTKANARKRTSKP